MTYKVYTNEGKLGNQGCLQGLLTVSKLKVIPPLLYQLPVHTCSAECQPDTWSQLFQNILHWVYTRSSFRH